VRGGGVTRRKGRKEIKNTRAPLLFFLCCLTRGRGVADSSGTEYPTRQVKSHTRTHDVCVCVQTAAEHSRRVKCETLERETDKQSHDTDYHHHQQKRKGVTTATATKEKTKQNKTQRAASLHDAHTQTHTQTHTHTIHTHMKCHLRRTAPNTTERLDRIALLCCVCARVCGGARRHRAPPSTADKPLCPSLSRVCKNMPAWPYRFPAAKGGLLIGCPALSRCRKGHCAPR
jgi:hypothetical protein